MSAAGDIRTSEEAETNLSDYLDFHGWSPRSQGAFGRLWVKGSSETELAVPHGIRPSTGLWDGTLDRLANYEGVSRASVDKSVRRFWMDVSDFRATSAVVQGDHIAAEAGSSLFAGAWKILRSSATTARGPKVVIAGNYSPSGDRAIERAVFAQTEPGSYVLPLLVPITRTPDESRQRSDGSVALGDDVFERTTEESAERRVTRTMAQAISVVYQSIIVPDKLPSASVINEAVISGASREMVKALHDILSEDTVSGLDISFSWAPKGGAISDKLRKVEIPKAAAPLLKYAFEGMKVTRKPERTALSGPMLALFHPKGQNFGEATIEAAYRGHIRRVSVNLSGPEVLDNAHRWFRAHETLVVTGAVRAAAGGLRIDIPEDIHPVGQAMLFGE